ncbi:hypothetical protein [Paracoccus sp. ME4]|uniref:hypothetical protein n=1 Tax=Paracoccus sp. ME4 TaxID=3138066 RepID=UPI00398A84FE
MTHELGPFGADIADITSVSEERACLPANTRDERTATWAVMKLSGYSGKKKELEMGLKLNRIDADGAHGDLDGTPFRLEVEGGRYFARIGEEDRRWSSEGAVEAPLSRSVIRGLTYQLIAIYRNASRPAFA